MKKEKIVFNKNYPKLIKQIIKMAIGAIKPKYKNQEILDHMADILAEMDYIDKNCYIVKK